MTVTPNTCAEHSILTDRHHICRPDFPPHLIAIERFERRSCVVIKSISKSIVPMDPECSHHEQRTAQQSGGKLFAGPI